MFAFDHIIGGFMDQAYSVQLRCFSAPFFPGYDRNKINELNYGGKILLPNSSLDNLVRRNIQYPMLFKLSSINPSYQRVTHAGVLEFLAEEGKCYLPSWMMAQLMLDEGDLISIEYNTLPSATYAKFKALSTEFLHISNPRAMLEVELRKFSCLTKNDIVSIQYNDQIYEFKVMDLKPANAVTIIECDVNIEFDTPEGYVEPSASKAENGQSSSKPPPPHVVEESKPSGWVPFSGTGMRLDGKAISKINSSSQHCDRVPLSSSVVKPCSYIVARTNDSPGGGGGGPKSLAVDEDYNPGNLSFIRYDYKNLTTLEKNAREKRYEEDEQSKNNLFSGKGRTIKDRSNKK